MNIAMKKMGAAAAGIVTLVGAIANDERPALAVTTPTIAISNVIPDLASAEVAFDVTASEGELRSCYYVETPDDPNVAVATTATWTDTTGATHVAVDWDWTADYSARAGQITVHLNPDPGVTPTSVTEIHAECRVRYVAGYTKKRRTRSIVKNGTQTASRSWVALTPGGNCNYRGVSGDLLATCLYARSTLLYRFRTSRRLDIIGTSVRRHPGIFACHTSVDRDIARNRHSARIAVVTANPSGFAQCWIVEVKVRVEYFVRVKDYEAVDVAADWSSGSPSPTASPSTTATATTSRTSALTSTRRDPKRG